MDEPIQLPIDGVLDLHTFQPREIKNLVLDYLAACQERGILSVRIIHGKGIGQVLDCGDPARMVRGVACARG